MWIKSIFIIQIALLCAAVLALILSNAFNMATLPVFLVAVLCVALMMLLGIFEFIALIVTLLRSQMSWSPLALAGVVVGLLPIVVVMTTVGKEGFSKPRIHDISTDLQNPPMFIAVEEQRRPSDNPVAYGGEEVAKFQRQAYRDIQPLYLQQDAQTVFTLSLQVVNEFGWDVIAQDPETGIIEAYDKSALFGFIDDVVIRVQATGEGSRVDVRSASRIGQGDFGANANRIREFIERLDTKKSN